MAKKVLIAVMLVFVFLSVMISCSKKEEPTSPGTNATATNTVVVSPVGTVTPTATETQVGTATNTATNTITSTATYSGTPDCSATVVFTDSNLENAIRQAISIPSPTPITQCDLAGLTNLNASNIDISNISGIEYCKNLQVLYLFFNQISDISALSGLTNLQWLYLDYNQISEIGALITNAQSGGLGNGDYVYLRENPLSMQAQQDVETLRDSFLVTVYWP